MRRNLTIAVTGLSLTLMALTGCSSSGKAADSASPAASSSSSAPTPEAVGNDSPSAKVYNQFKDRIAAISTTVDTCMSVGEDQASVTACVATIKGEQAKAKALATELDSALKSNNVTTERASKVVEQLNSFADKKMDSCEPAVTADNAMMCSVDVSSMSAFASLPDAAAGVWAVEAEIKG